MDQQVNFISKLKLINEGVMKVNFNWIKLVNKIRPETEWSNYEQVEFFL